VPQSSWCQSAPIIDHGTFCCSFAQEFSFSSHHEQQQQQQQQQTQQLQAMWAKKLSAAISDCDHRNHQESAMIQGSFRKSLGSCVSVVLGQVDGFFCIEINLL
jgi:hypothetical protein